jgi:4-amino-4-deoxy-L-arabinose transferase-like glycosyltransferase
LALIVLFSWLWHRHSWSLAAWTLVFLLTFGHYTKYSATIMLEAPLSLGAILFAIGTFEFFARSSLTFRWLLVACMGAFMSGAAKGVVGLLFWGALAPYVLFFAHRDSQWLQRKGAWFLFCGISAAAPLAVWGLMTLNFEEGASMLTRYLDEQVFRSYSSDRGRPELYAQSWSWWTYPYVIIKYGWPWWWTVPLGAIWLKKRSDYRETFLQNWAKLAFVFFACLLVAFSTSHVRLPHYLHPTYMILAPIGAYAMWLITLRFVRISSINLQRLRWILLAVLAFSMGVFYRGQTSTAGRGQEFDRLSAQINSLPMACKIYVKQSQIEPYRMETYSLWYLKGRGYEILTDEAFHISKAAFSESRIWWDLKTEDYLVHPSCKQGTGHETQG